jgi:microcystin-dependent protein
MASARGYFNLSAHQRPNVGDTKTSVVGIDHMGWLKCDGRALQISDFKFLFDVIGYSFGSNTSNDFKLPSPAGRVIGHTGSGAGLTSRSMGSNVGTETHTLTINEMPTHRHGSSNATGNTDGDGNTTLAGLHNHGGSTSGLIGGSNIVNDTERVGLSIAGGPIVNAGEGTHDHVISNDGSHIHTMGTTGGSNAHNNMQPTLFLGNLFMYSGKSSYGNNPFTAGVYVNATSSYGSNLV